MESELLSGFRTRFIPVPEYPKNRGRVRVFWAFIPEPDKRVWTGKFGSGVCCVFWTRATSRTKRCVWLPKPINYTVKDPHAMWYWWIWYHKVICILYKHINMFLKCNYALHNNRVIMEFTLSQYHGQIWRIIMKISRTSRLSWQPILLVFVSDYRRRQYFSWCEELYNESTINFNHLLEL